MFYFFNPASVRVFLIIQKNYPLDISGQMKVKV